MLYYGICYVYYFVSLLLPSYNSGIIVTEFHAPLESICTRRRRSTIANRFCPSLRLPPRLTTARAPHVHHPPRAAHQLAVAEEAHRPNGGAVAPPFLPAVRALAHVGAGTHGAVGVARGEQVPVQADGEAAGRRVQLQAARELPQEDVKEEHSRAGRRARVQHHVRLRGGEHHARRRPLRGEHRRHVPRRERRAGGLQGHTTTPSAAVQHHLEHLQAVHPRGHHLVGVRLARHQRLQRVGAACQLLNVRARRRQARRVQHRELPVARGGEQQLPVGDEHEPRDRLRVRRRHRYGGHRAEVVEAHGAVRVAHRARHARGG
eukprot:1186737-Prorocentrum_minimum.AAC.3